MGQLNKTPLDKGPNKIMGQGMKQLSSAINQGEEMLDFYAQPKFFPRFIYMNRANHMFKKMLKVLV